MALELKQSLKLSQQLVMTPQLQQAIKLLQLNRLELAQHCANELLENPLLEEFSDIEESTVNDEEASKEDTVMKEVLPTTQQGTDDINWENYLNSQSSRPVEKGFRNVNPDLPSFESMHSRADTLSDHLLWQAKLNLDEEKMVIAEEVIGNLDENGYLMVPVEDIAKKLQLGTHDIEEVLFKIQEFDPVGVGARDMRECLMIQTRHLKSDDLVKKIITDHLADLEKKEYKLIAKRQNSTIEKVLDAVHMIQRLDPKPGRQFFDESLQYITPDIYVYYVNGEYVIVQNEDGLPKLKIANYYQSIMSAEKGTNTVAKEYINDKMRAALWLIRSIHQRQRTIYKVTESIVRIQKEFLEKGVAYLRPMVLKDVAEDIGMHESTVSRVTSNKYVHTPQGIFELKFFFNSSIKRVHGADVASEAVKERIRMIISSEDRKRPYSDQELVELLRQSNIDIARRTVAKYREMLGILSSSRRKDVYT